MSLHPESILTGISNYFPSRAPEDGQQENPKAEAIIEVSEVDVEGNSPTTPVQKLQLRTNRYFSCYIHGPPKTGLQTFSYSERHAHCHYMSFNRVHHWSFTSYTSWKSLWISYPPVKLLHRLPLSPSSHRTHHDTLVAFYDRLVCSYDSIYSCCTIRSMGKQRS